MLTYGGSIFISLAGSFEVLLLDWEWMSRCTPTRSRYLRRRFISRREVRKLEHCWTEHCRDNGRSHVFKPKCRDVGTSVAKLRGLRSHFTATCCTCSASYEESTGKERAEHSESHIHKSRDTSTLLRADAHYRTSNARTWTNERQTSTFQ